MSTRKVTTFLYCIFLVLPASSVFAAITTSHLTEAEFDALMPQVSFVAEGRIGDRGSGANIEARNYTGTPLHTAAGAGHEGIADLLISEGARVNARNDDRATPFMVAARKHFFVPEQKHAAVIDLLAARGANVDVADIDGATALHYAAGCGLTDTVKQLIAHGAYVNAVDGRGLTPLAYAAYLCHREIFKILRRHGAEY